MYLRFSIKSYFTHTYVCMYVEGERTQSYLLDIWYVCRERTYTILFIIYIHTQVYLERNWICGMTHSSYVFLWCMHSFVCHDGSCMHLYACQDAFMISCMCVTGLLHTRDKESLSDDPDTHIEYYSVIYSSMHIHFCFFIMLNPHPLMNVHYIFPIPEYLYIMRERTYSWLCTYTHTHVHLERDGICDL